MKQQSGQSLIEVTVGLVVLVPVVLVLIDLSTLFLGAQANESTCRNAARAAAAGDPVYATTRALSIINRSNDRSRSGMVSNFVLAQPVDVRVTSRPVSEMDQNSGQMINPGGAVTGTATVTTEVDVRPFVVQAVYGGKSPIKLRSQQTFPISFIQPGG